MLRKKRDDYIYSLILGQRSYQCRSWFGGGRQTSLHTLMTRIYHGERVRMHLGAFSTE